MVRSTDDQGAQPVFVKRFYFLCENMTDINKGKGYSPAAVRITKVKYFDYFKNKYFDSFLFDKQKLNDFFHFL